MKKSFYINAIWDEEANVFYSESDIVGLHIEAETIEDFKKAMEDNALDLVVANHIRPQDLASALTACLACWPLFLQRRNHNPQIAHED